MTTRISLARRARFVVLVTVFGCGVIACGGDDASNDAQVEADATAASAAAAADSAIEEANDAADEALNDVAGVGGVADSIADALGGDASAQLDDAIEAVGDEGVMGIVADQLGEGTTVAIDGANVTFSIPTGSNEGSDPITDCMVIGAFADEASTVKVVYPDGESTC